MIFSTGVLLFILGKIGDCFVDRYYVDWRDYAVSILVMIGIAMITYSLLDFASRYLI